MKGAREDMKGGQSWRGWRGLEAGRVWGNKAGEMEGWRGGIF